jgi:hypothetical protein
LSIVCTQSSTIICQDSAPRLAAEVYIHVYVSAAGGALRLVQEYPFKFVADTTDTAGGNFLSVVRIQSHAQTEILEMEGLLLLMRVFVAVALIGRHDSADWCALSNKAAGYAHGSHPCRPVRRFGVLLQYKGAPGWQGRSAWRSAMCSTEPVAADVDMDDVDAVHRLESAPTSK